MLRRRPPIGRWSEGQIGDPRLALEEGRLSIMRRVTDNTTWTDILIAALIQGLIAFLLLVPG